MLHNHNQELLTRVIQRIQNSSHGHISFQEFMELALYAPGLGYYVAGNRIFGEGGDFITAPEISPIFGHCLANALTESTRLQDHAILEFGAGSGLLAATVLQRLADLEQLPQVYYILEVSPSLRATQQETLTRLIPELMPSVRWLDTLPQQFRGAVIANEVLDAMPATTLEVVNGTVMERMVGLNDGGDLCWHNAPLRPETTQHLNQMTLTPPLHQYPHGYQTEINLLHAAWLASLKDSLNESSIFLIDYGYRQEEYYHPDRNTGTLQCYYQHQATHDPFAHLGSQDITCHVDFTNLLENAEQLGFQVQSLQNQANFLLNYGLAEAFTMLHSEASIQEQQLLSRAVQKLTDPQQMGELFKVAVLSYQ